jgi:hypothetical protein
MRERWKALTACPVRRWESFDARKETSAATSLGTPTYPTAADFESWAVIFTNQNAITRVEESAWYELAPQVNREDY